MSIVIDDWIEKLAQETTPDEVDQVPSIAENFKKRRRNRGRRGRRKLKGQPELPYILQALVSATPVLSSLLGSENVSVLLSDVKSMISPTKQQHLAEPPETADEQLKKAIETISEELREDGLSQEKSNMLAYRVLQVLLKDPRNAASFIKALSELPFSDDDHSAEAPDRARPEPTQVASLKGEQGRDIVASTSKLSIRITQEPLTAQNLTSIISALTELSTKYWLIAKDRFADLVEYTQTHNGRFAEEAHTVITSVSYNSPFNMDWKVDLSAPSVAEALITTIDGITQRQERLEKAKLDNQAKSLEIKEAEQKAEQDNQAALLEQEKQRLALEQRRLEVLEKQLDVQKKGIEYALEIAGKVVDTLHPGADPATRAMEIQTLLPNLVQLQNGKGLELAFPLPSPSIE